MSDLKPVSFFVPGEPVGKGRPRAVGRKRRDKSSGQLVGYTAHITPIKTENYEKTVAAAGAQAMQGRAVIAGPVLVEMKIVVTAAASWSKKKRAAALAGEVLPTKKPDIDNVEKALFDAMNGVVWVDDVQVVNVSKSKRFGETPGVTVRIVPLVGECS